jgi:hypothetical protein
MPLAPANPLGTTKPYGCPTSAFPPAPARLSYAASDFSVTRITNLRIEPPMWPSGITCAPAGCHKFQSPPASCACGVRGRPKEDVTQDLGAKLRKWTRRIGGSDGRRSLV